MNAVDRLIVALPDRPSFGIAASLHEIGVRKFKLNATHLMRRYGLDFVSDLRLLGCDLMLDLKVYDVDSTVWRVVERSAEIGVWAITVERRSVGAAIAVSTQRPLIFAVSALTSDGPAQGRTSYSNEIADGIVCHPGCASYYRSQYGLDKIIVCPGVRPSGYSSNDHIQPMTPRKAIENGADYIVVGRPITDRTAPIAATEAIIKEMET